MIIKDKNKLKQKCINVSSNDEGEQIAAELLKELSEAKSGIGLAANQIGINKRVCVVNVTEPLYFINPRIIDLKDDILYNEGCLSFPNKVVTTKRSKFVTIESDNMGRVQFGPTEDEQSEKGQLQLLESVCVQHEIDHLDGLTMYDRKFKQEPLRVNKIGRNEKVTISNGSETKVLKYKKAQPLLSDGWDIVTDNVSV